MWQHQYRRVDRDRLDKATALHNEELEKRLYTTDMRLPENSKSPAQGQNEKLPDFLLHDQSFRYFSEETHDTVGSKSAA